MSSVKKELLIFNTMFYPYLEDDVAYDSYVDKEIEILAEKFEKIIVIPHIKPYNGIRKMPENVFLHEVRTQITSADKLKGLRFIFKKDFYSELFFFIRLRKKLPGITVLKLLFGSYAVALAYLRTIEKLVPRSKEKTTYIYSYWLFEFAYAAGLFKKNNPQVKVFSRAHSLDIYFERSKIKFLPLKYSTIKLLDAIYFISDQGRSYVENYFSPNKKFSVSRLGVIKRSVIPQTAIKQTKKFKIVSNSWIQPLKRLDLLIDALILIPSEYEVEWFHIGEKLSNEGSAQSIEKYAEEQLAKKTNIRYHFLGRMHPEEIFNFYKSETIHLFINLSSTEGVPVSIMEAESFGIPVIATNVGGVSEIVSDELGFLLHPDSTPTEICNKILSVFQLPEESYLQLCKNAYNKWDTDFNAEKNYTRFVETFFKL